MHHHSLDGVGLEEHKSITQASVDTSKMVSDVDGIFDAAKIGKNMTTEADIQPVVISDVSAAVTASDKLVSEAEGSFQSTYVCSK